MRSAVLAGLVVLGGCSGSPRDENLLQTITESATDAAGATPSTEAPAVQAPPASPVPEQHLQALGTEPFWSIEVKGTALRYSSPDNLAGTQFSATRDVAGKGTRYSGTLDGKPLTLLIMPGECGDGMSDTVYPLTATLTWGERTERGCARPI